MKIFIKNLLIISAIVLGLGSCKKYLDVVPDNIPTIEIAFSDRNNAEKYLATCYSYLPGFGDPWTNPALEGGDEVMQPNESWRPFPWHIAEGFQSSANPIANFWDGEAGGKPLYTGIRDCNIFLENINSVEQVPESVKKTWIAEVTFLKAFYHFWLLKSYGPIPIVDQNQPIYTPANEMQVYREPVDTCVNYIIRTLNKAIPDLQARVISDTEDLGRITQPIALSVKAKVLALAASPLFNGNSDFATLTDNRGKKLFNAVYDPGKWILAVNAAKEAIASCQANGISLVKNYATTETYTPDVKRELMLRSIVTERRSPEIIWSATHSRFVGQSWCQPLLVPVTNANPVGMFYAPTLKMAEMYYTNNGVPIEEDKNWDYAGRYGLQTATNADADFIELGEQTARLHFKREIRFYANMSFDRAKFILEPNSYYVHGRVGELATKVSTTEYSASGYFLKKLINPKNAFGYNSYTSDYNFPWPIIRLADIYLLYAEALNESKAAPDAEVYEYIDMVRERAGLKGVVSSWETYSSKPEKVSSKSGMREIIQQERMIEMAFEGERFWDLRRWKLASKYMNQPIKAWDVNAPGTDFYQLKTLVIPTFGFKDYLWPIKESELVSNPNLVQNPGW